MEHLAEVDELRGMESLLRELVSNVLSRLPAMDLMQCKCVCKSWFDLISDPHFISNYYLFYNSREMQQHEHLMLTPVFEYIDSRETEISIVSWNLNEPKGLFSSGVRNPPPYRDGLWVDIMGPCNGIYFLKGKLNIIMNPSLSQFIVLPQPHFQLDPIGDYRSWDYARFGFDPKTGDYKVVLINNPSLHFKLTRDWRVEVYSFNSNSWKILENTPDPFPFSTSDESQIFTYVNDCCHWWCSTFKSNKDGDYCGGNVILSFDMVSELFRKIKLLETLHSSPPLAINMSNKYLIPFSESATIGVIVDYHVDKGTGDFFCFDVWMMKDYWDERSWIKRYSVGPIPVIYNLFVGYYGSNQFLLNDIYKGRLVLYEPGSEKQTKVFWDYIDEPITVVRYMESLVSLQRKNQSSSNQ